MFEKEAEEYAKDSFRAFVKGIREIAKIAFQKGAEFGYNKGFEFGVKSNEKVNQIVANEWHYVSEKGLPKESGRYLVYVGGGENGVYPLDFDTEANDFGYWCLDVGDNLGVRDTIFETVTERNEDKVIAWKEIVLPKEEE